MLINSELPLNVLKFNNDLNEFDFVLFHLYISNKEYKEYFKNQRINKPERLMILDNSAYEFFVKGEELNMDEFYNAIIELRPDIYILPDVLMDKKKTINGIKEFINKYAESIEFSKPMAVVQGNSIKEFKSCLKIYSNLNIAHIALPFHNRFFWEMGNDGDNVLNEAFKKWHGISILSDDMKYAIGRIKFISIHQNILSKYDYIHLLGSHDPFEKFIYNLLNFKINTMDTGYPIKCALEGWELGKEPHKPNTIIDDFLDKKLTDTQINLIHRNMDIFKNMGTIV